MPIRFLKGDMYKKYYGKFFFISFMVAISGTCTLLHLFVFLFVAMLQRESEKVKRNEISRRMAEKIQSMSKDASAADSQSICNEQRTNPVDAPKPPPARDRSSRRPRGSQLFAAGRVETNDDKMHVRKRHLGKNGCS